VVGILHRDLKPENIVLARQEGRTVVKVMDFGVARRQHLSAGERRTLHGMVLGTPLYLSPEQAVGLEVDARTDVYSVGVIMFRMLTGRLPFTGDNAMDLIIAHRTKPPPKPSSLLPELGPDVDEVVLKALEKLPANRYPQMTDLEASIASLAPAEVPVQASGPLEEALRWIEAIPEGKHYQLLQVDPGADVATIDAAVNRAVQWFDQVGPVGDAHLRQRVEDARARLTAARHTLLDLRERALYDAEAGDFVGVARGYSRGLPVEAIAELRAEFLRRRPHFDARAQPAAVAELVARGAPEEALSVLARMLTEDPLNLELQRHYWGLRRKSAAPH
jgi:hypothetical protein